MEYIDWLYIFYLTPTSHFLMLGLYLPLLVFLGRQVYQVSRWKKLIKLPLVSICVMVAFLAPVFDVIKTGLDMHYYCNNEHGEHIYKTATTESVYGKSIVGANDYLKAGYKFIETAGLQRKLTRFSLSGDELIRTLIKTPVSEFEIQKEVMTLENNIYLRIYQIRSRSTQEVLGETKHYSGDYGRLDRVTPDLGAHVFGCFKPAAYGSYQFVLQVLTPTKD